MKIQITISFCNKLVDYQLMVLFFPVIPKYLAFVSIEYTVALMFSSMLQLLQNNGSLDIVQCLPPRHKLHANNVALALNLIPNCFGVLYVYLWHSKQFEPSLSARILNDCVSQCKLLPIRI